MSHVRRAAVLALLVVSAQAASDGLEPPPPGALDPVPAERRALFLGDGSIHAAADPTAPVRGAVAAGEILDYYGETNDTFGRPWHIVGDRRAWVLRERWLATPLTVAELLGDEPVALLASLPAPERRDVALARARAEAEREAEEGDTPTDQDDGAAETEQDAAERAGAQQNEAARAGAEAEQAEAPPEGEEQATEGDEESDEQGEDEPVDDFEDALLLRRPVPPLRAQPGWWATTIVAPPERDPTAGPLLAAPADSVAPTTADELIALLGGSEALGPWPEEPVTGELFIPELVPLVFLYRESGWTLGERPRLLGGALSLLGNPLLTIDEDAPVAASGPPVPCWTLAGAVDPGGTRVGRVAGGALPPTPVAWQPRSPGERWMGAVDLSRQLLAPAPRAAVAPRLVLPPPDTTRGAMIEDNSRRQAVYLEQTLPAALTARLRGRAMRLRALARALPGAEVTTITVGIEIVAGGLRETVSGAVGKQPTPITMTAEIPADAETITVRLLPLDRSIAVQERGSAIFERVELAPVEWEESASAAPLILRRVYLRFYTPARRFTRVPLIASDRPIEELRAAWSAARQSSMEREELERVIAGEAAPGMRAEHLVIAWGEPATTTRLAAGAERWEYEDRSVLVNDGAVVSWSIREETLPPQPRRCPADGPTGGADR